MLRQQVLAAVVLATLFVAPVRCFRPLDIEDTGTEPLLDASKLLRAELPGGAPLFFPVDAPSSVVQQLASSALGLGGPDRLVVVSDNTDDLGLRHVRCSQVVPYYGSVASVDGSDFIIHINQQSEVYSITGTLVNVADLIAVPLPPSVGRASARSKVIAHARGRAGGFVPPGLMKQLDLRIVPTSQGLKAVWCSETDLTEHAPSPALLSVCVSGHGDGGVLESRNVLQTAAVLATGKGFFFPSTTLTSNSITGGFELRDPKRGSHFTMDMKSRQTAASNAPMVDTNNIWGSAALSNNETVAADAHYGAQVTWDYFKTYHNRSGIANDGVASFSRVHYGLKYNNAFWADSCFCMTYGDGDGVNYNPFTAIDVMGHEMTHGLTTKTAALVYNGESGGLNEAISDIFGTMVEFMAFSSSGYAYALATSNDVPDYMMGEKLYKSGSGAMRYMYRPSLDGKSPDCYSPGIGTLDVHYSSGPANHWFYLLSEGSAKGSLPKSSSGSPICANSAKVTAVTGIGNVKAARIVYRALTVYMTSSTDYLGARKATLLAAADLFKSTSVEFTTVGAAWSAVNVTG